MRIKHPLWLRALRKLRGKLIDAAICLYEYVEKIEKARRKRAGIVDWDAMRRDCESIRRTNRKIDELRAQLQENRR